MLNFTYSNIKFGKQGGGDWLNIRGEIQNCTGRDFNAVVFRIIVFVSNTPKANVTLTINGFPAKQAHYFEKEIENIVYNEELRKAIRCEIYPESAY